MSMNRYRVGILEELAKTRFFHPFIEKCPDGPIQLAQSLVAMSNNVHQYECGRVNLNLAVSFLVSGIFFVGVSLGLSDLIFLFVTLAFLTFSTIFASIGLRQVRHGMTRWATDSEGNKARLFFERFEAFGKFLYQHRSNELWTIEKILEVKRNDETLKQMLLLRCAEVILLRQPSMDKLVDVTERRLGLYTESENYVNRRMEIIDVCYKLGLLPSNVRQPFFDVAWEMLRKTVKTHSKEKVIAVLAEGADKLEQNELPATSPSTKRPSGDSQVARNIAASMDS